MPSEDLDGVLLALADPVRRAVVARLRAGPCRAGEMARDLDVAPPSMSKHLRILRKGGLIEERRIEEDARVRLYALRREPFLALHDWLAHVEEFWSEQLGSFARQVRRRKRRGKR